MNKYWYESKTGNHQGLIIEEETGRNVAVTYDKADAAIVAAAPEMLVALQRVLLWGESEIHNEYDGTSMLKKRLAELNFVRNVIAKVEVK